MEYKFLSLLSFMNEVIYTATQLYLFQAKQHDAVGYAEEAMRLEPPESHQMSEKSGWTANAILNWLLTIQKFL